MVNAQNWLDNHEEYNTKQKRAATEELHLNQQLEGTLDLADFTYQNKWGYGGRIYFYPEIDNNKFQIINKSDRFTTIKLIAPQAYLDKKYPLAERTSITKLYISGSRESDDKKITGTLDLTTFSKLEVLNCYYNKLTNLILPTNSQLKEISCYNNNFTNLIITEHSYLTKLNCFDNSPLTNLTVMNNPQLTELNCHSCKLSKLTLTNNPRLATLYCSDNQLTNLNWLTNSNNQDSLTYLDIRSNKLTGDLDQLGIILNQFTKLKELYLNKNTLDGSLKSLQNLINLRNLDIENTNINDGWEYLPETLKKLDIDNNSNNISENIQELTLYHKKVHYKEVPKDIRFETFGDTYIHHYLDILGWKENQPAFQKLKEQWEKINPGQNIWDFFKERNIFFNVKLGEMKADSGFLVNFWENIQENIHLRNIIDELSSLQEIIREQKELINKKIQSYPSERGLLEEFVKTYINFKKLESKKISDETELDELEKKYEELEKLAKNKVERKFIREIKKDCDKLIELETDISKIREWTGTATIVNNSISVGNVNVRHGHAFIGNTQIGDYANLSYLIEQAPKK